ncbi:MAG: hypothetical protein KC501_05670 [Myxococcales bacterium]|nr:hypothetical protein [Myxococcales bacterium]
MPFDGRDAPDAWPPYTLERIAQVASRRDPVRRNLEITQLYHRLTLAIGERMGTRDLLWTGHAVWASKTAGHFIRGDWMPPELRRALARRGGALARMLTRVEAHVRAHVAEGNRLVFAEIAPLFAELRAVLHAPTARRPVLAGAMLARLRPGSVERGGQAGLARAMRAYLEAVDCGDDEPRAQLVLLANLEIGYHEQWRLQASIRGALEATRAALPDRPGGSGRVLEHATRRLRRPLTRLMMRLRTPDAVLHMGRDVPWLSDGRMFPADLEHARLPALRELLAIIDRTPNTTEGSAARDWADFGDRMNYVADMFRVQQQVASLWLPPFSDGQVRALQRGELPRGPL